MSHAIPIRVPPLELPPNSFRLHTCEKYPSKSFELHTYEMALPQVLWIAYLRNQGGGGGATVAQTGRIPDISGLGSLILRLRSRQDQPLAIMVFARDPSGCWCSLSSSLLATRLPSEVRRGGRRRVTRLPRRFLAGH